jgi:hypothetical protein
MRRFAAAATALSATARRTACTPGNCASDGQSRSSNSSRNWSTERPDRGQSE